MAYEIRLKKQKGSGESFTFPAFDAHLDKKVVRSYKLEAALMRLAKQLVRQYRLQTRGKKKARTPIGVSFSSIGVQFILDPADE